MFRNARTLFNLAKNLKRPSEGLSMQWIEKPSSSSRVLFTGPLDKLEVYHEKLTEKNIPSVFWPTSSKDPKAERQLEVWFTSDDLLRLLDEIAGHAKSDDPHP